MPRKNPLSAAKVRELARAEYAAGTSLPDAIRKLDVKAARPTIGLVSPVYWYEIGAADPIPGKSATARRNALAKRRASGVRFEVLAASLGATLGRKVSRAEIDRLLRESGRPDADPDASYSGRGTRRSKEGEATRTVRSA